MTKQVFFSYSWKDLPIAMRIYEDLVRSGISVWRDEFSAKNSENYDKQINKALDNCEFVVLLDSPNSRASKYVMSEWKTLTEKEEWKSGKIKPALCLIGSLEKTHEVMEIFTGLNQLRYIDFSGANFTEFAVEHEFERRHLLYDNERIYALAIRELCASLGVNFVPIYEETSTQDFRDELLRYRIKDIDRTLLLEEFELIQQMLQQSYPRAISRLKLFKEECDLLKLDCPSPTLQLGIEYLKKQQYVDAKNILTFYTQKFNDDSRGWRALAYALFELHEYKEALNAYQKAIGLILTIKRTHENKIQTGIRFNHVQHLSYLLISKFNEATTLFRLNCINESEKKYLSIFEDSKFESQILPKHYILLIDLYNHTNQCQKRKEWIDKAIKKFPGDCDINMEMARYLVEKNEIQKALPYFECIAQRKTTDIKFYAEYLLVLKSMGSQEMFNHLYKQVIVLKPKEGEETYYYGLILYLNEEIEKAEIYYEKSNCTELP